MFEKDVFPFLKKKYERGIVEIKIFHTTGVPESVINEKIKDIVTLEKKLEEGSLKFSILAHVTGVDIKMVVFGTNEMLMDKTLRNIAFEIRGLLKEDIYSEDGKSMEKGICELLVKAHKNLAVAESCTGGLLAHKITNVTGSSAFFLGGMVTYSDFMKKTILGVKEETITNFKAVSRETAGEMAECVRKIMASDFGLSTTGVAGPGKSSDGIPAGTAYIALARDSGTIIKELKFAVPCGNKGKK